MAEKYVAKSELDSAIEELCKKYNISYGEESLGFGRELARLSDRLTADVRPERHGHIVIKSRVLGGVETYKCPQCNYKWQKNTRARVDETLCSECGAVLAHSFQNYCPRCGAKMDGKDGDMSDR